MGFLKKLFNSGADDEVDCLSCNKYLGIRKDLIVKGMPITEAMHDERRMNGQTPLSGTALYFCPHCLKPLCL